MAIKLVYTMPVGNMVEKLLQIDGPNPYTVGGQPYTANELYMGQILEARVSSAVTTATGVPTSALFAYLQPNREQQGSTTVYVVWTTTPAGGTEDGADDVSAQQFYMWVRGWE
jgi:hypothetical protein